MLLKSVITLLMVVVSRTSSDQITCQMVSFEIEDGLSGYCCVFVKNNSEIQRQREEIKQQILEKLKNETTDEVPNSTEVPEVSGVNFPEDKEFSEKAITVSRIHHDEIKFPDGPNYEQNKNVSLKHSNNVSVKYINGTLIQISLNQSEINFPKDAGASEIKSKSVNNNTTPVITINRNAVDTPETCPDGNEKDHNGDCVPVF